MTLPSRTPSATTTRPSCSTNCWPRVSAQVKVESEDPRSLVARRRSRSPDADLHRVAFHAVQMREPERLEVPLVRRQRHPRLLAVDLSFEAFLSDMGEKPRGDGVRLERVFKDGDFEPDNCE
jgi:hypothetical protein